MKMYTQQPQSKSLYKTVSVLDLGTKRASLFGSKDPLPNLRSMQDTQAKNFQKQISDVYTTKKQGFIGDQQDELQEIEFKVIIPSARDEQVDQLRVPKKMYSQLPAQRIMNTSQQRL